MPSAKRQKRGRKDVGGLVKTTKSDVRVSKNQRGKKDRRLKKRQDFLTKLQSEKDAAKEKKAAKKRAETPVVGDLNPMSAALAELSATIKSVDDKPPAPINAMITDTGVEICDNKPMKLKGKRLRNQILNDILLMKSALGASSTTNTERN